MKRYLICTPNFYVEADSEDDVEDKAMEEIRSRRVDFDITEA